MSSLISVATGDWTSSSTWKLIDSTSLKVDGANTDTITTGYRTSQTFTPGAITIEGIAIQVYRRPSALTGTITVALDQGGSTVSGTEIAIDAVDIDYCGDGNAGWYLFKFGSPVTLLAATAYGVKVKQSSGSNSAYLYRGASSYDWNRLLMTSTTQAPAAGDTMFVIGEHTGSGTGNSFTVTQNEENMAVDYGPGTDGSIALVVGKRGTLTFGATAAKNYNLRLSGNAYVYYGGTLNQGTTGTPMPADSTAFIQFDSVAAGGMGLTIFGGAWNVQGASKTRYVLLGADAAANATTLTGYTSPSGWRDNDVVALGATSRTYTETEKGALNGVPSGTSITVDGFGGTGGGIQYAHAGSAGGPNGEATRAELINLTSNVGIGAYSSSYYSYVYVKGEASVDIDYAEFYYLGTNSTNKYGVSIGTSTGTPNIQNVSVHDVGISGLNLLNGCGATTVSAFVGYNLNSLGNNSNTAFDVQVTTASHSISDVIIMASGAGVNLAQIYLRDLGSTYDGLIAVGCNITGTTVQLGTTSAGEYGAPTNTINLTAHSNRNKGIDIIALNGGTINSLSSWRNGATGMTISGNQFTITTGTAFGNTNDNITVGGGRQIRLKSFTVNSENSYSSRSAVMPGSAGSAYFFNSSFGVQKAHSTSDILYNSGHCSLYLNNCVLGSTTEVSYNPNDATWVGPGFVRSHKNDQTSTYKTTSVLGTVANETTTRHTASGNAWKLSPTSVSTSTYRLIAPGPGILDTFKVAVNANSQVTVKMWFYKSSAAIGTPRLVIVGGILTGIDNDVTASMTAGSETWEELTVQATPTEEGVLEFYADCYYSASGCYVIIDDVTVTQV